MKRKYNADGMNFVRCGHPWCTDCRTKRGRNRGNRRIRRLAKAIIKREDY